MRRLAILALALAIPIVGCLPKNAPLPNGAVNAADAQINANLQAAHAALTQYEADVTAGKHTPDANEKALVNKVIVSLNSADVLYESYHAQLAANPGAGEPQQLIDALTAVATNISTLQTLVQGVK